MISIFNVDKLDAKKVVLFNVVEGLVYRDAVIVRTDVRVNPNPKCAHICQVDGLINQSWVRPNIATYATNQAQECR